MPLCRYGLLTGCEAGDCCVADIVDTRVLCTRRSQWITLRFDSKAFDRVLLVVDQVLPQLQQRPDGRWKL